MRRISRRRTLAMALGAMAGAGLPGGSVLATTGLPIPPGAMTFRRRLERSLRGDAVLVVERSWVIEFTRQGLGISVRGTQVTVAVDAPPSLARLVEIEESRSTSEMWPILLSETGEIVAAGDAVGERDVGRALEAARNMIANAQIVPREREMRLSVLEQFGQAGDSISAQMPADLFYPSTKPLHMVRAIDLPDGMTGEFEVTYTSRSAPESGWLDRAERQVVTRVGDSEKRTREEWVMHPS